MAFYMIWNPSLPKTSLIANFLIINFHRKTACWERLRSPKNKYSQSYNR